MADGSVESMVGGTMFRRRVIQREISRALVLNPLWQKAVLIAPPRISLSLTPPSLLSRGTRQQRALQRKEDSFLLFLCLPQASAVLHSFCTSLRLFPVAIRTELSQSEFIET
jgi:hypothetical protein